MSDFLKNKKQKIRFYVFLSLVIVSYFFVIFYLFRNSDILASIVWIFFLFIFFHFLSLDLEKIKKLHLFIVVSILILFDILLVLLFRWQINTWLIISIIILNMSFLALFYSLDSVEFSSLSHFMKWWYIFTFFITITYSFALIGMFKQFPFTCDWLKEASNQLVDFVERPFILSTKKISVQEEMSQNEQNGIQTKIVDQKIENVVLWVKNVEIFADSGSVFYPLVSKFNLWKTKTIDQIILDQENYSASICDMLLTEINEKYKLKEFGISAILLTYLLLFGFIRLSFFIINSIWFLLFKLLYLMWLYKIHKVKVEVNKIK